MSTAIEEVSEQQEIQYHFYEGEFAPLEDCVVAPPTQEFEEERVLSSNSEDSCDNAEMSPQNDDLQNL